MLAPYHSYLEATNKVPKPLLVTCKVHVAEGEEQKQMDLALREIADGKMTYRKAAIAYGIPKSTLHDHVSGKVKAGAGVGVPKYLTNEEDEVVRWLEGRAIVGCAKNIREVRVVVGTIVAKKLGVEKVLRCLHAKVGVKSCRGARECASFVHVRM